MEELLEYNKIMSQEQPTNFNREIDKMLTQSEERIKELRDLNRPLYPWEKERLKERLTKIENQETWDKNYLEKDIIRLKKETKIVYYLSIFIIIILLFICILFGYGVWIRL
jgi:DNA-binding transcriptional regulator GbsR (MarR family)